MKITDYSGVERDLQTVYRVKATKAYVAPSRYARLMYLYETYGKLPATAVISYVDTWFQKNAELLNVSD